MASIKPVVSLRNLQATRLSPLFIPVCFGAIMLFSFLLMIAIDKNQGLKEQVNILKANKANATGSVSDQAAAPAPTANANSGKILALSDSDHVLGDRNAPILLVEYSDMECPYCKLFNETAAKLAKNGKVAWVYRHFPLSFHANAQVKAESAECVAEQKGSEAFFSYLTDVMTTSDVGAGFRTEQLYASAAKVGVNQDQFKQCIDSHRMSSRVSRDSKDGSSAGVNGTPGSYLVKKDGTQKFVNGALPYDSLVAMIDTLK